MVPKETLIEERLDGLTKTVEEGFARADARMEELFARSDKMDEGFASMPTSGKFGMGFGRLRSASSLPWSGSSPSCYSG